MKFRTIKGDIQEAADPPRRLAFDELQAELEAVLRDADAGPVLAVDILLRQAILHGASDVHFEPWSDRLAVRFRIDGILHDAAVVAREHRDRITARIKILARLVVYQNDLPQDGRIEPPKGSSDPAMRVSTFPTVNGEKTVVRVLGATRQPLPLDTLGFGPETVAALRELVTRPQGTLLLTGPSSSGKTTTIYALLRELLDRPGPVPHIVAIEDPVEYRVDGISQTEVRPHAGFTFAAALRAVLRQDPEVIVIGEIRDAETAKLAIQAGLTGHRVISTIHSGTAAGVFTRLIDMDIEPFLVASSVAGVLAQRLVRKNCPVCLVPYTPEADLRLRFGIGEGHPPFLRGDGCDACQGIGYRGRTAIGELLRMSEALAEQVLQRRRTRILHETAVEEGMVPLADDGLRKARAGETTLEELRRVLPPPEEKPEE